MLFRPINHVGRCNRPRRSDRNVVRVVIERLTNTTKTIVSKEVKEAVFNSRPTNRPTELLLLMNWLRQQKRLDGRQPRIVEYRPFRLGIKRI